MPAFPAWLRQSDQEHMDPWKATSVYNHLPSASSLSISVASLVSAERTSSVVSSPCLILSTISLSLFCSLSSSSMRAAFTFLRASAFCSSFAKVAWMEAIFSFRSCSYSFSNSPSTPFMVSSYMLMISRFSLSPLCCSLYAAQSMVLGLSSAASRSDFSMMDWNSPSSRLPASVDISVPRASQLNLEGPLANRRAVCLRAILPASGGRAGRHRTHKTTTPADKLSCG
mmetsp:Transcript_4797/g.17260  ORF Transcript_4797/g.17260 Transcript_4797/m.17260 type:complete len:227 (+) Transcript_4797:1754-2434(+)